MRSPMRARATASCAPAKLPTPTMPTAKPASKPGRAGRASWREANSGKDLRRHIRLGLSQLEAGLLSREASLRKISRLLRYPPEHCRGELHVSPFPHGKAPERLDRRHSSGI